MVTELPTSGLEADVPWIVAIETEAASAGGAGATRATAVRATSATVVTATLLHSTRWRPDGRFWYGS
ncbi:hypothetical protein B7R21_14930 [Subtercola boreus]|uniref:Uncharacterized protein n=1 Tax=Subtercola boreus TaxID=120213 RepID=A0A3E0VC48_9MICO|nr:hypothetical protein B7R21_14930 [Subtercola boreus]